MLKWFSGKRREPGWLAVSLQPSALSYAHGRFGTDGQRGAVDLCGTYALEGEYAGADRVSRELGLERYQCTTLLAPGDYQLLLVEALNVPPAELKTAIRWRVKDMLDFHVDDATIDVLDIPPDPSGANRAHSMYAVAAKNDVIQECIGRFERARLPLSVIDIPDTAQRNLASLYESEGRGVAMLYFGEERGLLTINFNGELYLSRRIEAGMRQMLDVPRERRDEAFNRVVLELQRTLDHFDRQFRYVAVGKLLLAPEPRDSGLAEFLGANLDLPVERVQLTDALAFGPAVQLDREGEWRLFHLLGASLRNEAKGL